MDASGAGSAGPARPGEMGAVEIGPRALAWATGLLLAVGLGWRLVRYLAQFPIWGDEAFVLLNLLDLDYRGLAGPLRYAQVAPVLFLWVEETALLLCGPSELALRLVPVAAGMAGLVLFGRLARRVLDPVAAVLAVGVLAVAYYPVRHCCEVKPYGLDLLAAVGLLLCAVNYLRDPRRVGWLVALAGLTPLALVASYPAVFVAGGVSLVLVRPAWSAGARARGLFALFNVLLVGTFLGHYLLVGRQQISPEVSRQVHDFMQDYWRDSFPPAAPWHWPAWLVRVHTGNLLAYPVGGSRGASVIPLALALVGAAVLWRQRRGLLLLCLVPFGLTLVAAAAHKYPYGGSARVAQHLAPAICLLIGAGAAAVLRRLSRAGWGRAGAWAVCLGLAGFGTAAAVRDWARPYKTVSDREARGLVRGLADRAGPGDLVLVCNDPADVASNLLWYLRTEPCAVRWLGRDERGRADARQLWLLRFDQTPPTPARVLSLVEDRARGWTATDCGSVYLPPENSDYPPCYCTTVRLTRPAAGPRAGAAPAR